jgi:ABC-type transport system substrate-binding protein
VTRARALGALVCAALILGGACTDDDPRAERGEASSPPSSSSPTPGVTPRRGGSIRVGVIGAPATLDPYSPVASDLTYALVRPIYPSLYELSPRGRPLPALAWKVEPTASGARVFLRRARWSDGAPVTADDVVASVERATEPSGFARVHGARAVSRRVVALDFQIRFWERALATSTYVLPGGVGRVHRGGLVGGRAWRSSAYRPGLKIVYEPNRRIDRAERPYLDRVTVLFYETHAVLLEALRDGRVDVAVPPSTINLSDRLDEMGVIHDSALGWESVWMDLQESIGRPERAAIVAAIDRDALEDGFVRDDGRVATTLHPGPRGSRGLWHGSMGKRAKVQDPVRLSIPMGDELLSLVQRGIQIQLSRSKIDLDTIVGAASDFYGPWRDVSPSDVALVRSAGAPGLRDRKRQAKELTALPLFHVRTYVAWRDGIEGIAVNPTLDGPLWDIESWWLSRRP